MPECPPNGELCKASTMRCCRCVSSPTQMRSLYRSRPSCRVKLGTAAGSTANLEMRESACLSW
uniref:Uncharacterized protein n=1 Tax=Zea mays TaxID=4577 RepID=C4IZ59_MAIZE|nr:unknown [Zea mays]